MVTTTNKGQAKINRESYSIGFYCKSGSWQPEGMAALECLSNDEQGQLSDLVVKLLNNGVLLDINYLPVSDILGCQDSTKAELVYSSNPVAIRLCNPLDDSLNYEH